MQIRKMSKGFLVLLTLLTSLNSHANWYKFSCDNEKEDSTAGEVFYNVEGNFNATDFTLGNVTLKQNKVTSTGDLLLGQIQVDTLKPENRDQNGFEYNFGGRLLGQIQNVKISFESSVVRGLKYRISLNDRSLGWCTPLYK